MSAEETSPPASRPRILSLPLLAALLLEAGCQGVTPRAPVPERTSAAQAVGLNATPTEDPSLFTLFRPMRPEGLRVGIAQREDPNRTDWLEEGADFTFDADAASITLRRGLRVDEEDAFLLAVGTPEPRDVFLFRKPLPPGSVRVSVGDRELREGEGFVVEEASGRVRILDPAFGEPGVRCRLTAGNVSFGIGTR